MAFPSRASIIRHKSKEKKSIFAQKRFWHNVFRPKTQSNAQIHLEQGRSLQYTMQGRISARSRRVPQSPGIGKISMPQGRFHFQTTR
jgi:hypothetical protein